MFPRLLTECTGLWVCIFALPLRPGPRAACSNRAILSPPLQGDIWQYQLGEGQYQHLVGRGQGFWEASSNAQAKPHNKA